MNSCTAVRVHVVIPLVKGLRGVKPNTNEGIRSKHQTIGTFLSYQIWMNMRTRDSCAWPQSREVNGRTSIQDKSTISIPSCNLLLVYYMYNKCREFENLEETTNRRTLVGFSNPSEHVTQSLLLSSSKNVVFDGTLQGRKDH